MFEISNGWTTINNELVDLNSFDHVWMKDSSSGYDGSPKYYLYVKQNGRELTFDFKNKNKRDQIYKNIEQHLMNNKKKGRTMMESIRSYFKKHEEILITIGILLLIDEYIFEGKFRDKIKDLIDSFITKTKGNILEEKPNE